MVPNIQLNSSTRPINDTEINDEIDIADQVVKVDSTHTGPSKEHKFVKRLIAMLQATTEHTEESPPLRQSTRIAAMTINCIKQTKTKTPKLGSKQVESVCSVFHPIQTDTQIVNQVSESTKIRNSARDNRILNRNKTEV